MYDPASAIVIMIDRQEAGPGFWLAVSYKVRQGDIQHLKVLLVHHVLVFTGDTRDCDLYCVISF